jgi:hypothetical protein
LNIELFKKGLEKIEWTAEGHCAGADTGSYTAKLWPWLTKQIINAALAAKAPQGVPAPKPDAGLDAVERDFSPHVAAPKPAPPISEFTPEDMPVVTVSTGAPPNASPPSWRRSLAEKAKDEMSEFEKGFPYDGVTPAPGAERFAALPAKICKGILFYPYDEGSYYEWALGRVERLVREALAAALPVPGPVSDDTIHHGIFPPRVDRNGLMGPSSDALWSKAYNEGIKYGRSTPAPARPEGCICSEAYGVGPEQCGCHNAPKPTPKVEVTGTTNPEAIVNFANAKKFIQEHGYQDWDGSANGQLITLTGCANMMAEFLKQQTVVITWGDDSIARKGVS